MSNKIYHDDAQRLFNRANRRGKELAAKYGDTDPDVVKMWVESAIRAEIDTIARNGLTVKQSMDFYGEPYE